MNNSEGSVEGRFLACITKKTIPSFRTTLTGAEETSWTEYYKLNAVAFQKPEKGKEEIEVMCNTCGENVKLEVRSNRWLALRFFGGISIFLIAFVLFVIAFDFLRSLNLSDELRGIIIILFLFILVCCFIVCCGFIILAFTPIDFSGKENKHKLFTEEKAEKLKHS